MARRPIDPFEDPPFESPLRRKVPEPPPYKPAPVDAQEVAHLGLIMEREARGVTEPPPELQERIAQINALTRRDPNARR